MEQETELFLRRALSEEVGKYREFLQNQFKFMAWGIGTIFAAGAIVFSYILGKSIKDSEDTLTRQVDSKVIEYRLVQKFKDRLDEHIQIAIEKAIDREDTQTAINKKLEHAVHNLLDSQLKQLEDKISINVKTEIQKIPNFDSAAFIKKVVMPKGSILAFNNEVCPEGWHDFKEGIGRFLVGIGNAPGLKLKNLLESGGEEEHVLLLEEMPIHKHETVESGDPGNSAWGVSGPRNSRHGVRWENFQTSYTSPAGGSKPHNNLPPYIGVLFCEKD